MCLVGPHRDDRNCAGRTTREGFRQPRRILVTGFGAAAGRLRMPRSEKRTGADSRRCIRRVDTARRSALAAVAAARSRFLVTAAVAETSLRTGTMPRGSVGAARGRCRARLGGDGPMTDPDDPDAIPPGALAGLARMDLVRRARGGPRGGPRSGQAGGTGRRSPSGRSSPPDSRRRWSGPGPTDAIPKRSGGPHGKADTRGWSPRVAEGTVFAQWPQVVGDQIAEHAQPTALRDGC